MKRLLLKLLPALLCLSLVLSACGQSAAPSQSEPQISAPDPASGLHFEAAARRWW